MAFGRRVERADPNQTVDAVFDFQVAVDVDPFDQHGCIFNPRFLARLIVEHLNGEVMTLGPAGIHSQQNRSPVLRFCPPGSRVDRQNGVVAVVFAAEEHFDFHRFDLIFQFFRIGEKRFDGFIVAFFFRHFVNISGIAEGIEGFGIFSKAALRLRFLFLDDSGGGRIIPKFAGVFEFLDLFESRIDNIGTDDVGDVLHFGRERFQQFGIFVMVHKQEYLLIYYNCDYILSRLKQ